MSIEIPLNGKRLAAALHVHPSYVTAMKSGGYVFTHGSKTLLSSALTWLSKHPEFRSTGYRRNAPGFVKDLGKALRMRARTAKNHTIG